MSAWCVYCLLDWIRMDLRPAPLELKVVVESTRMMKDELLVETRPAL